MSKKALDKAIKAAGKPPRLVRLGFDLWLDVFASGEVENVQLKKGGARATEEEAENTKVLTVPMPVYEKSIFLCYDPTLGPDEHLLVP